MGRAARHDVDGLLDAAVALVAEGGPGAVTMSGVARRAGASSGSVYHRFADQSALLSALWLRTVRRFHAVVFEAMAIEPASDAAVQTARSVMTWCAREPGQARVLLAGPEQFGRSGWDARARDQLAAANTELVNAVRGLAERLGRTEPAAFSRLLMAVIDLPYAVIRRHLRDGAVPQEEIERVAEAAADLLGLAR